MTDISHQQAPRAHMPDNGNSTVAGAAQAIGEDSLNDLDSEAQFDAASAINLRYLYGLLQRYRWVIIGITTAVALLGVALTLLITPRYTAAASVQIDQEAKRVLESEEAQSASAYQDAERFLRTQVDVLRSRRMAERVISELKLADNDQFLSAMGAQLPDGKENSIEVERKEFVIKTIQENLNIFLPADSRVVIINFTSPDPELAAKIANVYSSSFLRYNVERRFDSSSYARDFLSGQLSEAEDRLQRAEREANTYARSIGLIKTPSQGTRDRSDDAQTVTTSSLVQLNTAMNQARAERIAAESKWKSVSNAPNNAIAEVVGNKAIQDLYAQRALADAQLQGMLATRQDDYPGIAPLREQVAAVDRQINILATGIRQSIRDEYRAAVQRESALSAQVSGLKSETLTEQDRSVRYNILAREVDTSRELYNNLLQRFREVSAEAGITNNNVSQIDVASIPVQPSSPRPLLNLALSIMAGFVLSGIFIFLREQLDDKLRSPADIETKLALKLIGLIPKVEEGKEPLELLDHPFEPITEAFNALRANLQFSVPGGTPKILVVTSAQPAEGKSSTAYGIARSIAKSGKTAILLDCDLRRPSVHHTIGSDNEVGTSSILTGQATIDEAVRTTDWPNMDVITSGPLPPSPTELLASTQFIMMCTELAARYDHVMIDGPPVLGLADAPILSSRPSIYTLFIVKAGLAHRGAAKGALRRLRTLNTRIIGAVFTQYDFAEGAKLGYDYGYEYGYGNSYYTYGR